MNPTDCFCRLVIMMAYDRSTLLHSYGQYHCSEVGKRKQCKRPICFVTLVHDSYRRLHLILDTFSWQPYSVLKSVTASVCSSVCTSSLSKLGAASHCLQLWSRQRSIVGFCTCQRIPVRRMNSYHSHTPLNLYANFSLLQCSALLIHADCAHMEFNERELSWTIASCQASRHFIAEYKCTRTLQSICLSNTNNVVRLSFFLSFCFSCQMNGSSSNRHFYFSF
jgi:hypothetical protein